MPVYQITLRRISEDCHLKTVQWFTSDIISE